MNSHHRIQEWERLYLEEGGEGLVLERRGRASRGGPRKAPKGGAEDLLTEVERLRAENNYLKNLYALLLEEE